MSQIFRYALPQLGVRSPLLIVCVIGVVFAMTFLRRCRLAGVLTLIALLLTMAVVMLQPFVTGLVIYSRERFGWSYEHMNWAFLTVAVVVSLIQALSLGLLVTAVFSERGKATRLAAGPPFPPPRPPLPTPPSRASGAPPDLR